MHPQAPSASDPNSSSVWSMLDFAPDGIVVADNSGTIVFANRQSAELFRTSTESLVGSCVDDLLPAEFRGAHRAHRTRYRVHPEVRAMGAGLLLRARRSDDTEFHAEISLSPYSSADGDYVIAAVRDISERVSAEDHLRRVMQSLDASDDAIAIFDATSLQFLYVNAGTERMVGYDRDDLLTMTPLHVSPSASAEDYHQLVASLLADPDSTVHREATVMRRDGTEVPVEMAYRAGTVGHDQTQWVVAVGRDITARLAAESEIREHQAALLEAERIVMLVDDRERIARDLHDTVIQRLFAAGLGLQSILRVADDVVRPRLERTIDELDTTIRELRSAIFSLGSATPTMGGLRGRVLDVINEMGGSAGIETRVQFDGPIETLDPSIAEQLVPVVTEAMANAAKHSHARNVRVSVTVGDEVVLSVTDDGVGVSGEVIGGHGIVNLRERAASLGGTVSLDARPNGGSELRWVVPRPVAPASAAILAP